MPEWSFKHSIQTKASRKIAWDFLSDMSNQVRMESSIERIELDGPFVTGTNGRTVTKDYTQEWKLNKVIEREQFEITGITDNQDANMVFRWTFEDAGTGSRLIQHIKATGSQVENYMEIFRGMEKNVPNRMTVLKEELDRIAEED